MSRLVLASSFMGKTYTNNNYENVYDFDQHTLSYKYYREEYPHLTDEQFKGLPGRKIREGWFEKYMDDFCDVIDADYYDVVIGWLCKDVADELLCRGYLPELVVFDNEIDPYIFLERGLRRGNEYTSVDPVEALIQKNYMRFVNDYYAELCKVWVAHDPVYLSEFLVSTGSMLYRGGHADYSVRNVTGSLELLQPSSIHIFS